MSSASKYILPSTRRTLSSTAPHAKAIPFFLHNSRHGAQAPRADDGTLRMIMFGKPGAGKGTLSACLVKKFDILSISTGDLLRQHIAEKTDVGILAKEIVASGGLIPDDVMLRVVASKLDALRGKHWILDGFPRTLGQGELLEAHLLSQGIPLSLVVNLEVPDEIILSRISDRWVHLPSGRVYNLSYNRPKVDGLDDETGEPLTKRPDDNPEIFARRLKEFYASTSPLLTHYSKAAQKSPNATRLVTLTGKTSDEIWPLLEATVQNIAPKLRLRDEERRRTSVSEAMLARSDKRAVSLPSKREPSRL